MSNKGLYLIQPESLNNTNYYKFGISNNLDNRIKSYGKKTKILYKFITKNPKKIENLIIIIFKDYIYCGNEYIEYNDINSLYEKFINIIHKLNILYRFLFNKNDNLIYCIFHNCNKDNKNNIINIELLDKSKKINYNILSNNKISKLPKNKNITSDKILYICLRCKYSCSNKFNFRKHLIKKNLCNCYYRNIETNHLVDLLDKGIYNQYYNKCIKEIKCDYCDNYYSSKSNMIRHRNICNYNPNIKSKKNINTSINDINIINNINYEQKNNINFDEIINYGKEIYDINDIKIKILEENEIEKNFNNFIENYINNFNTIFDNIYSNRKNLYFRIKNKRSKICELKINNLYKIISLVELTIQIFNIINNIFNKIIEEDKYIYYINIINNIINKHQVLSIKYGKNNNKNLYYDNNYLYFKTYKTLIKNCENKIIYKYYEK